ncbi:hypothetical protein ACFL6Y_06115, partial [Elusimicrobiota bacterium]
MFGVTSKVSSFKAKLETLGVTPGFALLFVLVFLPFGFLGAAKPTNPQTAQVNVTSITYNYELGVPASEIPFIAVSTAPDFSGCISSQTGTLADETPRTTTYFDLDPNTTYYFKVKVVGEPDANYSDVVTTTTFIEAPALVYIDEISSTSIVASAYASSSAFTNLNDAFAGINISCNTEWAGWEVWGDSWTLKFDLPTSRKYLAVVTLGGKIYAIGGDDGVFKSENEEYDPVVNLWLARAPMITARRHLAAAAAGGRIYAIGGDSGSVIDTNEEYDPESNLWLARAPMPTPRYMLAAASADGKIYVIGGHSGSGGVQTNEEYDPAANTWTTKASLPVSRYSLAAAQAWGKIYAIGGHNGAICAENDEYDPVADSWDTRASMPTARRYLGAASLGGKVYVIGGSDGSEVFDNERYDPLVNAWVVLPAMITARLGLGVASANGSVYAIGGDNGSVLQENEAYDPGVSARFADLLPNTQYSFTAKARNSAGAETIETAAISSYTLAAAPLVPADVFEYVSSTSLTIAWTLNPDNPAGTQYMAKVSTIQGLGGPGDASSGWDALSSTNIALPGNSTYYAYAKARNFDNIETGFVYLGSSVTHIEIPSSVSIVELGVTSVTLSADGSFTNIGSGVSGVNASKDSDYGTWNLWATTYSFTSLTANTQYDFSIKARNLNGLETPESVSISSYTAAALPIAPSQAFTAVSVTSLAVAWTPNPDNPGGTQYQVELSTTSDFNGIDDSTSAWADASSIDFTDVSANTTYWAQVMARNFDLVETDFVYLGSTVTHIETPQGIYLEEISSISITASAYFPGPGFTNLNGSVSGTNISKDYVYSGWHVYGGSWTQKAGMPTAREGVMAAVLNGKIYVIGGTDAGRTDVNEAYDPVSNDWTTRAPMPTKREGAGIAVVNNKIYVVGGFNTGSLDINEEYDPEENTWVTRAPMLTSRIELRAAALGGKIYAIGGNTANKDKNEEYDPVTNTWAAKASMLTGRKQLITVAVNGKIYAIGGTNAAISQKNEEYDATEDAWVTRAPMPTARTELSAASVGGKIYVIGGNDGGVSDKNEEYDPATNTWVTRESMPTARDFLEAVSLAGKIYVFGGNDGSVSDKNEVYDPGVSAEFTGLLPNSQYTFVAKARNHIGVETSESVYVSSYTMAAAPIVPSEPFSDVFYSSLTINWTMSSANPGGTQHKVELSTSSGFDGSADLAYQWAVISSTGFTDLFLNTTYWAQVTARNFDNAETAYVSLGSTATRIETPVSVSITDIWVTSAAFSVDGALTNIGSGISGVSVSTDNVYDNWNLWAATYSVTSLMPNTQYDFSAKATNLLGTETPETASISSYTAAARPIEVSTGSFEGVEVTSLTVSADPNGNPDITEYYFQVSTMSDFSSSTDIGWIISPSTSATGLKGNTTYYAQSKARNFYLIETGYASLGSTVTATELLAPVPSGPTNVSSESVTVNWTPQANPVGTTYEAQVSNDLSFDPVFAASATVNSFAVFSSLPELSTGFSRVRAVYQDDRSTWTVLASTMTLLAPPSNIYIDEISSISITASAYFANTDWIGGATAGVNISCNSVYAGWHVNGDSWDTKASMPTARGAPIAAAVNGKIYAMSGTVDLAIGMDVNEEYDPAADTWVTRAPVPTARTVVAVTAVNNKVYVLGGADGGGNDKNEEYDPVTNTWATRAPAVSGIIHISGDVVGGKIYLVGGVAGGSVRNEEYDPAANSWTTRVSMPTARWLPAVSEFNNKIYVMGGTLDGINNIIDANEEYDPDTNTWATRAPMPTARWAPAAVTIGGKIYVAGGVLNYTNPATVYNVNEVYDPVENTWVAREPMPTDTFPSDPPNICVMGSAAFGGKMYTLGGHSLVAPSQATYEYDPGVAARFTDLLPNTLHTFKAKARTSDNIETGESIEVSTYTYAALPMEISTGSFDQVYFTSMTVSFDPGANPPGTEFQIEISSISDFSGTTQASAWSAASFADFTSLQDITTYYARAKARNFYAQETGYVSFGSTLTYMDAPSELIFDEIGSTWIVTSAYFERDWWLGGDTAGVNISCNSVYAGWHVHGDSWTTLAVMPTVRDQLSVVSFGGLIYAIGGHDDDFTGINEAYDPATDSWVTLDPMPTPRAFSAIGEIAGKIYVIGGVAGPGDFRSENEEYDPESNSWVTRAPLPTARSVPTGAVVSGKMYVVGGHDGAATEENEAYDPAINTWNTDLAALPTARAAPACAVVDQKIYVIGGQGGSSNENEKYDPITNTWVTLAVMPTGRQYLGAANVGKRIYVIGGSSPDDENEAYDTALNLWSTRASMPAARGSLGVVAYGGRIYAIGGNGGSDVDTNEVYDPGVAIKFTDLTPNAQYLFKSKARDSFGMESSETIEVSTYTAAALPTVLSTGSFSEVESTSMTVSWQANNNPVGTQYYVELSSYSDYSSLFDPGWMTDLSKVFTGLEGVTTYYVRIKARNAIGNETYYAPFGSTITQTGLLAPVPGDPVISSVTIRLNWSAQSNPSQAAYEAIISTDPSFGYISASSYTANTYAEVLLLAHTTYYTRVRAAYGMDRSSWTIFPGTMTHIQTPTFIYFDDISSYSIVASAYNPDGFSNLEGPVAGINISCANVYAAWHVYGSSWSIMDPITNGRSNLAGVAVGGKVYVIGGNFGDDNLNHEYDPVANSWNARALIPTGRNNLHAGVVAVGEKVYVIGGYNDSAVGDNEEYDPETNTWVARAPMLTARQFVSAAVLGGKIYAIGGNDGSITDKNEEYDPAANTWVTRDPMPTARQTPGIAVAAGKIYAFGGSGSSVVNEAYDPSLNSWTTHADIPTSRDDPSAASLGGKIYVIGDSAGTKKTSEAYDPQTDSWTTHPDMPTGRWASAIAAVGGKIYVIGGVNGTNDHNERYDPGVAIEFTDLTPNAQYTFRAKARNQLGRETQESQAVSTYTAAAFPQVVSTGSFSSVFATNMTVSWDMGGNPAGTQFRAQVSTVSDFSSGVKTSDWEVSVSTDFTGLSGLATYYARVKARNALNMETTFASIGSTITKVSVPQSMYFEEISSSSIVASAYFEKTHWV